MLVLSRRTDENIYFPNVGITVKILRVKGRVAKIGIEAPPGIKVLRDDMQENNISPDIAPLLVKNNPVQNLHQIRNQLNIINLGVHLYRQQANAGMVDEANLTFLKILDDLDRLDKSAREQNQPPDTCSENGAHRVLVVEDDLRQQELLAGFLSMRGCNVSTANDGEEALNWLETNKWPDFLILDFRMPRRNGADTIRHLRSISGKPELKIFAVSGSTPEECGIDCGPGGIDCWFPKPLNPEALVEEIYQTRFLGSSNYFSAS